MPERDWTLPWVSPGQSAAERVRAMDEQRVGVHLLSLSPTLWWYSRTGDEATAVARDVNDGIAEVVADQPTRLRGLAHLPAQTPAAAVEELERAVRELAFAGAAVGSTRSSRASRRAGTATTCRISSGTRWRRPWRLPR